MHCFQLEFYLTLCAIILPDKTNEAVMLHFRLSPSDDQYRAWKDP